MQGVNAIIPPLIVVLGIVSLLFFIDNLATQAPVIEPVQEDITMEQYVESVQQKRQDFYDQNSSANCAKIEYPLMQRQQIADVCVENGIILTFWTEPMTNEMFKRYAQPVIDSLKTVDQ